MKLPKRKPTRLQQFDYSMSGYYFVTICTKDRKPILSQIVSNNVGDDAHIVPKPYGKIVEKYIKTIDGIKKYIIMPDHIHMIIANDNGTMWASSPTQSISQKIKSFKILVTKEIGQSIWQRAFYYHVIRGEQDYQEIWQYIENNPLKHAEKTMQK